MKFLAQPLSQQHKNCYQIRNAKTNQRGPTFREVEPQRAQKAFTLIELLVAISVIGILAGVLLPNFMGVRQRARDTQRKQDLNQVKKALRLYYNDFQAYPLEGTGDDAGKIAGCGATGISACDWGGEFSVGVDPNITVYMKRLPLGPQGTETDPEYTYQQGSDTDNFTLSVSLENESDSDIESSQTKCSVVTTDPEYVVCAD